MSDFQIDSFFGFFFHFLSEIIRALSSGSVRLLQEVQEEDSSQSHDLAKSWLVVWTKSYLYYLLSILQWGYLIFTIGYWHMALIFSVLNLWKPKLSWTWTYPWVIIWYQESWPQPQHGLTGGHFHEKSGLRKMGLDPRPIRIWRPFNVHLKPWY